MRVKWHFRNEPSESFSKTPAFSPKCNWKPPGGYLNLEVFLSQVENKLFKAVETPLGRNRLLQSFYRRMGSSENFGR